MADLRMYMRCDGKYKKDNKQKLQSIVPFKSTIGPISIMNFREINRTVTAPARISTVLAWTRYKKNDVTMRHTAALLVIRTADTVGMSDQCVTHVIWADPSTPSSEYTKAVTDFLSYRFPDVTLHFANGYMDTFVRSVKSVCDRAKTRRDTKYCRSHANANWSSVGWCIWFAQLFMKKFAARCPEDKCEEVRYSRHVQPVLTATTDELSKLSWTGEAQANLLKVLNDELGISC